MAVLPTALFCFINILYIPNGVFGIYKKKEGKREKSVRYAAVPIVKRKMLGKKIEIFNRMARKKNAIWAEDFYLY